MKSLILTLCLGIYGVAAFGHEGHHGPETEAAPHGGTLKELKSIHIEMVNDKMKVQLYPLDNSLKAVALTEVKMSATAKERKKSAQAVTASPSGDHWVVDLSKLGGHRVELTLDLAYKGDKGKLTFQVER